MIKLFFLLLCTLIALNSMVMPTFGAEVPSISIHTERVSLGDDQTLNLETMQFQPRKWLDIKDTVKNTELTLDEFPGTVFRWAPDKLIAIDADGVKTLIPAAFTRVIHSVFLADLNGDGLPEFCVVANIGSGISRSLIIVYDYAAGEVYELFDSTSSARLPDDYSLTMKDGQLLALTTAYMKPSIITSTGSLKIIDGELLFIKSDL